MDTTVGLRSWVAGIPRFALQPAMT